MPVARARWGLSFGALIGQGRIAVADIAPLGIRQSSRKNKLKQCSPRHLLQAGSRYATCHFFLYVNHRQHNVHRGTLCTIYVDWGISGCIGNNASVRTRYTAIRQAGPRPGYPLWTREFKARRPYLRNSTWSTPDRQVVACMACSGVLICNEGHDLGGDAISRVGTNTGRQSSLGAVVRRTNRPRAHRGRRCCSIGDSTIFQKKQVEAVLATSRAPSGLKVCNVPMLFVCQSSTTQRSSRDALYHLCRLGHFWLHRE